MKTPRELLLTRHRDAGPRLDAIRHSVIAQQPGLEKAEKPSLNISFPLPGFPHRLWRELVLPSRRIWTALAAVWLLLAIINISQRDTVSSVTGKPVHSPAVMMSWQTQQRLMNELLVDRATPPDADRPREVAPQPRTEECNILHA